MKLFSKLKAQAASPWGLFLMLLVLGILAYGLYIPWMGFYWDDWPWVWFSKVMGAGGMLKIDVEHRPISGLVLYLGTLISGDNPVGWQIINWIFRILGVVSLAWMLGLLWPDRRKPVQWVSLLFLVYPGFGQQFVAVNTSRHLLPLATFFLSLGLMIKAHRNQARYWLNTGLSLLFSLVTMFTTEYYYGLEFIRPVLLWILTARGINEPKVKAWNTMRSWLPYLLPLIIIFAWRYTLSTKVNYQVTVFETLSGNTGQGLGGFFSAAVQDVAASGFGVWGKIFVLPDPDLFGARSQLYYWGLVGTAAALTLVFLLLSPSKSRDQKWWLEAVVVGGVLLIIGPIPFWVTGLDIKGIFPFDRLTLPMMVGSSLMIAGLLDAIIRTSPANLIFIPAIVGLSVGHHYQNGITYRRDWQHQQQFFQQMILRIPSIKPGTAILSNELQGTYSTDNSLTAPLNWLYAPRYTGGNLPVYLYYVDLRFGKYPDSLSLKSLSNNKFRFFPFQGSSEQVLVIYSQPPGCPRVLSYDLHKNYPGLPSEIQAVLPYSNLAQIQTEDKDAIMPPPLSPAIDESGWCASFEKADLARQNGAWDSVAVYADQAFEAGHSDSDLKHVTEYEVFIEGYGLTSQWGKARQLTFKAMNINPEMAPLLCDVWDRIQSSPSFAEGDWETVNEVKAKLDCVSLEAP